MPTYPQVQEQVSPGVIVETNLYVTMRDGIKIAVNVYRPETEGRYPGLLSMAPYLKELQQWPPLLSHAIEAGDTPFFVRKGYVHVIATSRGSGYSQGQYNWYDVKEQEDGYDLIEWMAQQPWCTGNVSMLGVSYYSRIQYLIAALQPPHLKCIAPFEGGTDDYRDSRYYGGIINTSFLNTWGFNTIRQCIWPGPIEGKLPPTNIFNNFAMNTEDGPYYWERSAWTKIDQIKVPMLAIVSSGNVVHSRGQLASYPKFQVPKKLLIVPRCPLATHRLFIGSEPLKEQMLRWYDYWLKGIETGIMNEPEVAVYDSGTNEWRYENEYPLARTKWTKFFLRSQPQGSPAVAPDFGLLDPEPPGDEEPDRYITPDCLPLIAAGKPVIAFATLPRERAVRIWGPLSAVLYGSSTTLDTAWFVKVGDVDPEGNVNLLGQGHLKASFREVDESRSCPGQPFHPFRHPVLPEPNKIYDYQIEIIPIFHTFKVGHKIWVQIASDDFAYQQHPPTYVYEMLPIPAENYIYHDSLHPSHLLLPVIPDTPMAQPVRPPVSQIKWPS